jgi:hypothetical protein
MKGMNFILFSGIFIVVVVIVVMFLFGSSYSLVQDLGNPHNSARAVWNCFHSEENCLGLISTKNILNKCANVGDKGCHESQMKLEAYLVMNKQFNYSNEEIRFTIGFQNDTNSKVFVYTPLSKENFFSVIYLKKVGDDWLYDGVDFS